MVVQVDLLSLNLKLQLFCFAFLIKDVSSQQFEGRSLF